MCFAEGLLTFVLHNVPARFSARRLIDEFKPGGVAIYAWTYVRCVFNTATFFGEQQFSILDEMMKCCFQYFFKLFVQFVAGDVDFIFLPYRPPKLSAFVAVVAAVVSVALLSF